MKIILAQGNPGSQYENSRHNIGWQFIDSFSKKYATEFKLKTKFNALIAELEIDDGKALLVKPTTFYNETGLAARALSDFYKLQPEDFLIIHDDLALPVGTIRTRVGGESAGNNGIKSITRHLGENTARLRIGTYSELTHGNNITNVLGRFSADERKTIDQLSETASEIIKDFIANNFKATTYKLQL